MIGLEHTTIPNQEKQSKSTLLHDINKSLQTQTYCLTFEVYIELEILVAILSDYSILCLDLNKMKPVYNIPQAHEKRINDFCLDQTTLYTCSNDGSLKVWDLNQNKPFTKQFKGPSKKEFYSIAQVEQILAGGSDPDIHFWDLRQTKILNTFNETHSDEVTSLQFAKHHPGIMLSSSLDGMTCLFDLSKDNEEEAVDTVVRLEQPINKCNFIGSNYGNAFAQTTVQTISLVSFENCKVVKEVNPIENIETNQFSLVGAYVSLDESSLSYLRGNLNGYIEEYSISLLEDSPAKRQSKFYSQHKGPITRATRVENCVVSSGEDGRFYVTEKSQEEDFLDLQQIKESMFLEDEDTTDESNQPHAKFKFANRRGKPGRKDFDPFH